jgi:hypothetical protein
VPITIHSVESGVVFNIDITKVESGVTFNVNVTGTPTVNIQTSGGANIVIDKLTQGAYTERQTTLINDNGVSPPTAPPYYLTGTVYRGKFFPRGCRGEIRAVSIYCMRTGTGTLTLSMSPRPGMGPIASVTITPGSSWDWAVGWIHAHWNYDSLFIWVSACSSDVSYGYDATAPLDMYRSDDSGATWYWTEFRLFIRVAMASLTVGDLPVSGTVNTIEIPALSSARQARSLSVPAGSEVYDTVQVAAGELLICIFWVEGTASRDYLIPRIRCDGVQVLPFDDTIKHWHDWFVTQSSQGICIGVWDTTANEYSMIVVVPYSFRRTLEVGYYNTGTSTLTGVVGYSYKKIS